MDTYKIVRIHMDKDDRPVIKTGLSLAEAQAHCQRKDTHGDTWFDCYYLEEREWTVDEILRREG